MNEINFDSCDPDDPVKYYDRDGRQISLRQWGEMKYKDGSDYYLIGKTRVGRVEVSTVWLGLDHRFGEGPPIIFETLVFGGRDDGQMERYCTEAEARAGHDWWVAKERRLLQRLRTWQGYHLDDRRQTDLAVVLFFVGWALSFLTGSWWTIILTFGGGLLFGSSAIRRWRARPHHRRRVNPRSTDL